MESGWEKLGYLYCWLLRNGPENVNNGALFYNSELMPAKSEPSDDNFDIRKLYGICVLRFGTITPITKPQKHLRRSVIFTRVAT